MSERLEAVRKEIGAWGELLPAETVEKAAALAEKVQGLRETQTIYPAQENIFRAVRLTQPEKVKCVILGQDPYHGPGQAHGLSFSVPSECKLPPSLKNIYKEMAADLGCAVGKTGDLSAWAEQGVLLLNSVLTVEEKKPGSHASMGWQEFTGGILRAVFGLPQPVVLVLWGKYAKDTAEGALKACRAAGKEPEKKHLLTAAHPSPLSAYHGFFDSRPFSQTNAFLTENGAEPVDWTVVLPDEG